MKMPYLINRGKALLLNDMSHETFQITAIGFQRIGRETLLV
jgi:hypothetical protein